MCKKMKGNPKTYAEMNGNRKKRKERGGNGLNKTWKCSWGKKCNEINERK